MRYACIVFALYLWNRKIGMLAYITWCKRGREFKRIWQFMWTQAAGKGFVHIIKYFWILLNFLNSLHQAMRTQDGHFLFLLQNTTVKHSNIMWQYYPW